MVIAAVFDEVTKTLSSISVTNLLNADSNVDVAIMYQRIYDIMIRMDWLDRYNANILCSQKPQGREIIIYGDKRKGEFKLCSMMKARKYLSRGCQAYTAHVIDTSFEKKSAKDVPVVNEFLDVFPEDLPGIPPERQVEFRIDLVQLLLLKLRIV
ncbi:hypothetical protein Tco_0753149 [Tanacetum coccineum]